MNTTCNTQGTVTGRYRGQAPNVKEVDRPSTRVVQVNVGPHLYPVRQLWVPGFGWVVVGLPV